MTVPNGPLDTATFGTSNATSPFVSAVTEVNGIVFSAGASAFTITASANTLFSITGAGVSNNSGIPQNFVIAAAPDGSSIGGTVYFNDNSTTGTQTFFTIDGSATGVGNPPGRPELLRQRHRKQCHHH